MTVALLDPGPRAALAALLDTLIPASGDGRMPGAGELGLAETVEAKLDGALPVVAQGLAALDERARARGAAGFAALAGPERAEVLRAHAAEDPGLLPGLVFHTYTLYYQHARVVEALGLEPRPPHPLGYRMEQADLDTLLAPVRAGPRRYRDV